MADYVYSISNDIPGGVFTSTISAVMSLLIRDLIPAAVLTNIGTAGDALTISFQDPLTAGELLILDGGTTNPSGGIIGRSPDTFDISFEPGATVVTDAELALDPYPTTQDEFSASGVTDTLVLPADGITVSTVTLQYKDGLGADANGYSNGVEAYIQGLLPINKPTGTFDGSGGESFIVGPSFDSGVVTLLFFAEYLPLKGAQIRFGEFS